MVWEIKLFVVISEILLYDLKENKEDKKEKIEEEAEKVETLFGEEEIVKEKKKAKDSKPKKNIKEDFVKQLSLFDL